MRYTYMQLIRMAVRDLWNDGLRSHALRLYRNRHSVKLDRYGWPMGY